MSVEVLGNRLRIVTEQSAGPVSYIGLAVDAGSRDDPADAFGLAHFLEHTIFKGTRNRRAWHISNRMEAVGGELNAYTTKEMTMLYTVAPAGYEERALELLADLVRNASFPEADTLRERDIVMEEISSYYDSPSDAVFDEFDELIYAGSGMAHNILGSEKSVRGLDGTRAREFLDRYYTPANMALYCVTPRPEKALRLAGRYFGGMDHDDKGHTRQTPPLNDPFDITRERGNTQANTVMGCRIPGRNDVRKYPLMLFNNILGGPGLNSRLNQQVREKRGLVYTIESTMTMLSDCGTLNIYFGCDPENVARCRRLVREEIARLADKPLGLKAFRQAQQQYCGQLAVLSDNRENCAMSLGRSMIHYGRVLDLHEMAESIRAVTPEELRMAAESIAVNSLSKLTII